MAIGSTACWIFTVAISISFPSLSGAMGTGALRGAARGQSGACLAAAEALLAHTSDAPILSSLAPMHCSQRLLALLCYLRRLLRLDAALRARDQGQDAGADRDDAVRGAHAVGGRLPERLRARYRGPHPCYAVAGTRVRFKPRARFKTERKTETKSCLLPRGHLLHRQRRADGASARIATGALGQAHPRQPRPSTAIRRHTRVACTAAPRTSRFAGSSARRHLAVPPHTRRRARAALIEPTPPSHAHGDTGAACANVASFAAYEPVGVEVGNSTRQRFRRTRHAAAALRPWCH